MPPRNASSGRTAMPGGARDALQQASTPPAPTLQPTPGSSVFPNTGETWTTPIKNNPATPNPVVPGIGSAGNLLPDPNPAYTGGEPASTPGPLTGPHNSEIHGVDAPEQLKVRPSEGWGKPNSGPPSETGGM